MAPKKSEKIMKREDKAKLSSNNENMGTCLSSHSSENLQKTGSRYDYRIKEYKTWHLTRATSACTLCEDTQESRAWRVVHICRHRFHRSCLRDYRQKYGAICPTCDNSYWRTRQHRTFVKIDQSGNVTQVANGQPYE